MANYLEFTPNVSWAKVRVYYEESYDSATKTNTLTITSIEVMSTQHTAEYYVDGVLNVNGTAVLTSKSSTGNVMVAVKAKNTWYPIEKDGSPVTATVQIEGSETATIELTGNNFQRFAFYTVDGEDGNGWGVSESQEIALTVEKGCDAYSFWLGVALDRACVGLPQTKAPTAYLYGHVAKEGETPTHTINGVDYVGVVLPKLPEWDREMYPYAVIFSDTGLYASSVPQYLTTTDNGVLQSFKESGKMLCFFSGYDGSLWGNSVRVSVSIGNYQNMINGTKGLWANYDAYTEDGTLYLAASDPVPVYE